MLARRLPLLWTFAGGCLSGAALIALWPGAPEETETLSPRKQRVARSGETITPPIATTNAVQERSLPVRDRSLPNDAPDALPDDAPDIRAEPGSSVADVLASLEAAYRQGLAASAPAHAPSSAAREPAMTARTEALTPSPPPVEPAAALPAPAPPPTTAPQVNAVAHTVAAPETVPVLAARDDAQPSNVNVHVGDNNETTHVGDVYQGNVVLVQAPPVYPVYGYPQFVAPPSRSTGASVAYTNRGVSASFTTRGVTAQRAPTFASSWTVPNDRLGYDSALVPMLK